MYRGCENITDAGLVAVAANCHGITSLKLRYASRLDP